MGGTDANTKRDEGSYSLSDLSIEYSADVYGDDRLTINLQPNPVFGTGGVRAIFNEATRKWELEISANTKFHEKLDTSLKRKVSITDRPQLSSRTVEWTRLLPKTPFVERLLQHDWTNTSLGSLENWPAPLQAYLSVVFADNEAAVIYWGEDLLALYNEEFLRLVTDRLTKPEDLMGIPFIQLWPELWSDFEPMLKSIAERGVGLETLEVNLFPMQNGSIEETFWQGSFLPIRNDSGVVQGFYNRAREVTGHAIDRRLSRVLGSISTKPDNSTESIYQHLIDCLSLSDRDFPMSFVYSVKEDVVSGTCQLHFQAGQGIPAKGHKLVPKMLDLFEGSSGFVPHFRKARSRDNILLLHSHDGSLSKDLLDGFEWHGFGEQARTLAILPLSTSERLIAILVIALNPRRNVDEGHEGFLNTMLRTMSATLSSTVDKEEAQSRADRLAKQLENNEKSIRELAEYGPVGIARYTPTGKLLWANYQYFAITGQSRQAEDHYEMSFLNFILPEDVEQCQQYWKRMVHEKQATSSSFRVKRTWTPPRPRDGSKSEPEQHVWLLLSGYPIMDGDKVKAYAMSAADISGFKWAEQVQAHTAEVATEAKRLQENFIDIVSHEMRNPLSAITQLSDAITNTMDDFDKTQKRQEDAEEILKSNSENAQSILLCSAHMKRIIDDVLTLSKLDSMLLSITPIVVQPWKIIEGVLKMFEAEFIANDIEIVSEKAKSYADLGVDWVTLDPSRLTQIFINLITNAVKFTRLEATRKITIRISASLTRPPSLANVNWFPTNKKYKDLTSGPEWGTGEQIFICFEVQDTGRGLEQKEMTKLFGRFQQATEKTHLKYGGSGLGLFISRELTETQGGEIGVISARGRGTTFAFYIKARMADAPQEPANTMQPLTRRQSGGSQVREAEKQRRIDTVDQNNPKNSISILLCEDNIVNSKILKQQLERSNCQVHVASHGMEALDYLGKSRAWKGMMKEEEALDFDVILMDVGMPIMDGLTCTRRIRQLQEEGKLTRHINVIAITANARQEQIDTVIRAGADAVLPKPFRVKECIDKIQHLLNASPNTEAQKRKGSG